MRTANKMKESAMRTVSAQTMRRPFVLSRNRKKSPENRLAITAIIISTTRDLITTAPLLPTDGRYHWREVPLRDREGGHSLFSAVPA